MHSGFERGRLWWTLHQFPLAALDGALKEAMLYEFIALNREEIIARTRRAVGDRAWPSLGVGEIENGVPVFLTQLAETLRRMATPAPYPADVIGNTAALHGRELVELGFTPAQVVNDYGDICQAITALAAEQKAPITVEEFHTLNRCLDTAIAEAVAAHAHVTAEKRGADEAARLGHAAHELRDYLNTALVAFHTLKRGNVAINGSTAAVLGRSLMAIRSIVDSALSDVRLTAGAQQRKRLSVPVFIDEIAAIGLLHAEDRDITFDVDSVTPGLTVDADPQLLASAVLNLVNNAFKNTPKGGHVTLRAFRSEGRLVVEVEDECGGIPDAMGDLFRPFGERRGADRSGLGLGLSIARRAVRAHGGDISIRNAPGKGCVFVVEVPLTDQRPAAVPA